MLLRDLLYGLLPFFHIVVVAHVLYCIVEICKCTVLEDIAFPVPENLCWPQIIGLE